MLPLLVPVLLAASGTIDLNPTLPRVDVPVTFTLATTSPLKQVSWDFGDGTLQPSAGPVVLHAYRNAGTYTVQASYPGASGAMESVQRRIAVGEPRRITFAPATAVSGVPVTFTAREFLSPSVGWSFGDGTPPVLGTGVQAHVFARSGVYTVTARDLYRERPVEFTVTVDVLGQGPGAIFTVSYLALRWEDGTTDTVVGLGGSAPVAFADVKFEGTGILQARWLVDGRPVGPVITRAAAFAETATFASASTGEAGALPTNLPGEHDVTLQVLSPPLAFQAPVLRYSVNLEADAPPAEVLSVNPGSVRAGEEAELVLTGRRFHDGMVLDLGRDVALTAPLQVLGPGRAVARIFVAPSARSGVRPVKAARAAAGPARLRILPPRRPQP